MTEIPELLRVFDEASDVSQRIWETKKINLPETATEAPMAVYGDSVDGETCPPSESVDIPPRELIPQPDDGPDAGLAVLIQEPIYIAMGQAATFAQKQDWWKTRQFEAIREGCDFFRYSVHPGDPCLILIEGWKGWPGDQGEPRWFMVKSAHPHSPTETDRSAQ